jgi:hypothetical protein
MVEYSRFEIVDAKEVDWYLSKGWQIIDSSKSAFPEGDIFVKYHIGYPTSRLVEDLTSIIREYEKRGFKEKLFDVVAAENSENVDDYETTGFYDVQTPLTKFMVSYEEKVNNKKVKFYKEPPTDDTDFKF